MILFNRMPELYAAGCIWAFGSIVGGLGKGVADGCIEGHLCTALLCSTNLAAILIASRLSSKPSTDPSVMLSSVSRFPN